MNHATKCGGEDESWEEDDGEFFYYVHRCKKCGRVTRQQRKKIYFVECRIIDNVRDRDSRVI